jgi:hypothetical protein
MKTAVALSPGNVPRSRASEDNIAEGGSGSTERLEKRG